MYVSMEEEIDKNLGSPREIRGEGGRVNKMHSIKLFSPHFHEQSSTYCAASPYLLHLLVIQNRYSISAASL